LAVKINKSLTYRLVYKIIWLNRVLVNHIVEVIKLYPVVSWLACKLACILLAGVLAIWLLLFSVQLLVSLVLLLQLHLLQPVPLGLLLLPLTTLHFKVRLHVFVVRH
jgi:hypothetical protein